jgi:RNA polymerase sigma factor (sigma-70 family)
VTPLFRAASTTAQFDRLYRQHAASVYRYARAVLGNHADAEDVTQQTFLNAYRALAQGTKPRKAENWLVTIAHNEIRRHLRDTHAQRQEVELDAELADKTPERTEPSVTDVLRALQHLTANQRSALVMREFEGRTYAEIAEIMGISQGALETLMFRARRTLAAALEDGLTCADAELAVSRRLDGRLSRREARRLKKHVRECQVCKAFELRQRRQRSLLNGLSVIPVPASLLAFRGEQAAAALGGGAAVGAVAAGGSAGIAAKAAAVAAAVTVAGGVGYTAGKDRLPVVHRQAAQPAQAAPKPLVRQAGVVSAARRPVVRRPATVPRAQTRRPKARPVMAHRPARSKPQAVVKATRKAEKVAVRTGGPKRATKPLKAKATPRKAAPEKATPEKAAPEKATPRKAAPEKATPQRPVHEPKPKQGIPPKRERPAQAKVGMAAVQPGLEKKLLDPKPEKTKS